MNSEELEASLRTEFENYLKNVFAETRQEISQLQTTIEAEFEKYRAQLHAVFQDAIKRADADREFDAGFRDSVTEHLRLARDEGARITATAFAEAEAMEKESAPEATEKDGASRAGIKELHEAINDISGKGSQAEILKTLVQHASTFATRGAFFIIKNEHFVGWRTFGSDAEASEDAVREVFLPISSDSILSEAVRSLATVESSAETYQDDAAILSKLDFGSPEKMYAIPLVARGRGVAVLYADYGTEEESAEVNIEALETMVRVAGLTVEVLASARGAAPKKKAAETAYAQVEPAAAEREDNTESTTAESSAHQFSDAESASSDGKDDYQSSLESPESAENAESETASFVGGTYNQVPHSGDDLPQNSGADNYAASEAATDEQPAVAHSYSDDYVPAPEKYPTYEDSNWNQAAEISAQAVEIIQADSYVSPDENHTDYKQSSWNDSTDAAPPISAQEYAQNFAKESDPTAKDYSYQPTAESYAATHNEHSVNSGGGHQPEMPKVENFEAFAPSDGLSSVKSEKSAASFSAPVETVVPAAAPPVKTRLSERNVDLPIEVSEDERRLHNDARRFARLLVSEIKLYNEQKVREGRDASDLYDRLREAVDRSREMYDKRVQPPVAAKFDYFHYEIINTLAEGDASKLGEGYPGSSI